MLSFRCIPDFRPARTLRATGYISRQRINCTKQKYSTKNWLAETGLANFFFLRRPAIYIDNSKPRWCTTSEAVWHGDWLREALLRGKKTSNPRCGLKITRHLIKAENLKGLLGCPTCILFRRTSAIHKDEDGKIC